MSMRTRYGTIAYSLMLIMVAGCVRARVTRFDPTIALEQRTPPDQIKFYGEQRPRCPYKEVGSVSTESYFWASWSSVVRRAREKAFAMGGDAIIGVNQRTRISGVVVDDNGGYTTETTSLSGHVIRFTTADCRD